MKTLEQRVEALEKSNLRWQWGAALLAVAAMTGCGKQGPVQVDITIPAIEQAKAEAAAKTQINTAKATVMLFKAPLELYKLDFDEFPSTSAGLQALVSSSGDSESSKWSGPYMDKLPLDPWQREYRFANPGRHNSDSYDVWSVGPDGDSDTDDDIGNW